MHYNFNLSQLVEEANLASSNNYLHIERNFIFQSGRHKTSHQIPICKQSEDLRFQGFPVKVIECNREAYLIPTCHAKRSIRKSNIDVYSTLRSYVRWFTLSCSNIDAFVLERTMTVRKVKSKYFS